MISPASYIAGPAAEVELDDETGLLIALLLGMYDVLREPKVDAEGALQDGAPIEPRARGVELVVEQAIPVGERQDVRRDEAGYAMPVVVRALVATSATTHEAARPSVSIWGAPRRRGPKR